jgi:rod shape-determining protein MreD
LNVSLEQRARAAATMPPVAALAVPPWPVAFVALAIALLLQTTLLHVLHFRGGTLSAVFLVVLWYAGSAPAGRGAFFALIAGALEDALGGTTGAAWTVATPIAAFLVVRIVREVPLRSPIFLGTLTGFAALLRSVLFWVVMAAERHASHIGTTETHAALWSAFLDGLAAFAILVAFRPLRPPDVHAR